MNGTGLALALFALATSAPTALYLLDLDSGRLERISSGRFGVTASAPLRMAPSTRSMVVELFGRPMAASGLEYTPGDAPRVVIHDLLSGKARPLPLPPDPRRESESWAAV